MKSLVRTIAVVGAAAMLAVACAREDVGDALPAGVERLPGNTVLAWCGAAAAPSFDEVALRASLARAGLVLRDDVPGYVYAAADAQATGWAHLGASRSFREAWAERPTAVDADDSAWLFVDLQALVDHAASKLGGADLRVDMLVEPLALRSLEWAFASVRETPDGAISVDGLVRASGADVGLLPVLAGAAAPSRLGPPRAGEQLRVELRADPVAARRTVDAWMGADDGRGGLSMRDALTGVVGQLWQRLIAQADGAVSVVVDGDGRTFAAFGLREPDDTRDLLDGYLEPDGPDAWRGAGRIRAVVDGVRLVLLAGADGEDDPVAAVPAPGGPAVRAALQVDFARADRGAGFEGLWLPPSIAAALPGRGSLQIVHADAGTLRVQLRLSD